VQSCFGKNCGDDGCGSNCGECVGALSTCGPDGLCACEPYCSKAFSADADTVALWHFDEQQGQLAFDAAGESPTAMALSLGDTSATETTDPVWTPNGRFNGALEFGGTPTPYCFADKQVLLADNAFTVELWLRGSTATDPAILFTAGNRISVRLEYGKAVFSVDPPSANSGGIVGSEMIADGQWHYVAATYDGTFLVLYVDGVPNGTKKVVGTLGLLDGFYVGGGPDVPGLQGTLDEVRFSDVARSSEAIAGYHAGW
jgi:hypothetical protein